MMILHPVEVFPRGVSRSLLDELIVYVIEKIKLHPKNTQADFTGSVGYATSRSMADILDLLIGKTDHHVANSQQLAEDLAEVYIEEGEMFNGALDNILKIYF